jgi:hypothetical protein
MKLPNTGPAMMTVGTAISRPRARVSSRSAFSAESRRAVLGAAAHDADLEEQR